MTAAAYDLADRLHQLAPWQWMNEITLIAIEHPETGRRDHISIMGMMGNHRSLALYLGPVGRQRFNLIQERRDLHQQDTVALILDTPQLQCSFSPRGDLFKSELAAIKQAGKKYRGENWPSFRSFRPGHCPIPANDEETRWLCTAIEQVLEVAPTLSWGDDTLRYPKGGAEILTRRLINGEWRTEWTKDDGSLHEFPQPAPDALLVEKVRHHPKAIAVEAAFLMVPNPIGKSREVSLFPYFLLLVEPKSRFVLGFSLLSVEKKPYEELIASVPDEFLRICDQNSIRPASIAVDSPATHALLSSTAASLGIRCDLKQHLPALDGVFESMLGLMGGGF